MSPDKSLGSSVSSEGDLFALVYDELHRIASSKMAGENVYSTLQATALVHEAWLRLGGENQPLWGNRAHFFSAAAEAMRRILIDRARKKKRRRHGGELQRASVENLDALQGQADADDQLLLINEAIEKLAVHDSRKAELVKLRYFVGLSFDETASVLGISPATAKRWWTYSRSWLYREIAPS